MEKLPNPGLLGGLAAPVARCSGEGAPMYGGFPMDTVKHSFFFFFRHDVSLVFFPLSLSLYLYIYICICI